MKHKKLMVVLCVVLLLLGGGTSVLVISSHLQSAVPDAQTPTKALNSFARLQRQILDHSPNAELLVSAHRGQWRESPENSLAAINKAINDGAEIVEIDVRLTKDGVPVLIHDATVDRTTNGSGRVDSLTLAEIKLLKLRQNQGGAMAGITDHKLPTLKEAMRLVKNRAMVNLDKSWAIRREVLSVLAATDTVDHGIFKGSPTVDAAEAFMALDSRIQYMHVVNDSTAWQAFAFEGRQPVAVEVLFNSPHDPQAQPEYLDHLATQSRVWINSISSVLSAGNTDDASLDLGTKLGWGNLVSTYRANIIQTDNVDAVAYWRDGGSLRLWE